MKKLQLRYFTLVGALGALMLLWTLFWAYISEILNLGSPGEKYTLNWITTACYMVFFIGYFIHQKTWTLMRRLLLTSIICCALHVMLYFIGEAISGYFWYFWSYVMFLILWVPFCIGLCFYKNTSKYIKYFAVAAAVGQVLGVVISEFIAYEREGIGGVVSTVTLLLLLIGMYVLQQRNSRKV